MIKCLFHNASIEKLQNQANELHRGRRLGDETVTQLIGEFHPGFIGQPARTILKSAFSQSDARLVVARQYGMPNWRQLETFLLTFSNAERDPPGFLQLSCLNYLRCSDTDLSTAKQIYKDDPSIAGRDIYHACCVGDVEQVSKFLADDPTLVAQPGGYFGWEPLMYACYSRLYIPGKPTVEVARKLLAHGADPNAHFMWGGQYRFTALCGVFAEGEDGPRNYPEHEQCEAFARILLDAGANPNDGQALYNRMFTPGSLCLELLLEFGLRSDDCCNWFVANGDSLEPNTQRTMRYQFNYAIKCGFTDRVKLLVEHGVNLETNVGEKSPYESAMLAGNPELAEYLVSHGADRPMLDSVCQFASACMIGDEATARSLLGKEPDLLRRSHESYPELFQLAAETGRYDAIRIIAKFNTDLTWSSSPLFNAVWSGDLEMVKLLIELGADPCVRDGTHNATPIQWAHHHGDREDIMTFLSTCEIDIFDAIICNAVDRIAAMLDVNPSLLEITIGEMRNDKAMANHLQTPIVFAVMRQRVEIVRLLIERGAKTNYQDQDGKDLRELAKKYSTQGIVELLE